MSTALSSPAETGAPPAIEAWLDSLRGTYPDDDIAGFRAAHADEEAALAAALARARGLVSDAAALSYGDAVHEAVGALCIAAGVDGLRADLVMLRSARALAAWESCRERCGPGSGRSSGVAAARGHCSSRAGSSPCVRPPA